MRTNRKQEFRSNHSKSAIRPRSVLGSLAAGFRRILSSVALLWVVLPNSGVSQTAAPGRQSPEPARRIVMVGGVGFPESATKRFVEWSGGKRGRILVAVWGGTRHQPEALFEWVKRILAPFEPGEVILAPTLNQMRLESGRQEFRRKLAVATAIFFVGGDQESIMECVNQANLGDELRASYRKGTVFGGNSAGTAIMSATMITGVEGRGRIDEANTRVAQGLGLITEGIVDQHFIERQRQERLFSALMRSPGLWGLGVDEGNAVALEGENNIEVLGKGYVMLFINDRTDRNRFTVRLLAPGNYDLRKLTGGQR